jgi:hypothetical protein
MAQGIGGYGHSDYDAWQRAHGEESAVNKAARDGCPHASSVISGVLCGARPKRLRYAPVALVFLGSLAPRPAHAGPPVDTAPVQLPVAKAQRPLTLPSRVLAAQLGFEVDERPEDGAYPELDVSAAAGITDDLAIHVLVAPLELASPRGGRLQYGETNRNFGPGAGAAYRFVHGRVELAADLSGHVFTIPGLSGGSVTPAVAFRFHMTDVFRVDLAAAATLQFATQANSSVAVLETGPGALLVSSPAPSSANAVRVQVPVSLVGNATPSIDIGVTSGLTIYDASDAQNTTGIPLGLVLGYAVPGPHGGIVELDPFLKFPYLVRPGRSASVTNTEQYQLGVNVTGYLYL